MTETELRLSPSLVHRPAGERTVQALRYAGEPVEQWQAGLRTRIRELLGYTGDHAERCDLAVRSLWHREHPDGAIENFVFRAELQADVPAYICLPRDTAPPYTWFICLQGHTSGMHHSIGLDYDEAGLIAPRVPRVHAGMWSARAVIDSMPMRPGRKCWD